MKKFFLLTCALLFILTACQTQPLYRWDDTTDDYNYDGTDWTSDASYDDVEEETSDSEDSEPIPFNPPEEVAVDWPEPPAKYDPKVEVIPVVAPGEYFYHYLDGKTAFVDRNHKRVPIPKEARTYYMSDQCILLVNAEDKIAIMRFDGKVVTDFIYIFSSEEHRSVDSLNGFAVLPKKSINDKNESNHFWVLVDIQTGKEITRKEYEWIYIYDSFVRTEINENCELIDYNGKPFFDLSEKSADIYRKSYDRGFYYTSSDYDYLIDEAKKTVYRLHHENEMSIYWSDKLYLLEDTNTSRISIYNAKKELLLHLNDYRNFDSSYCDSNNFIVLTENDFVVVTKDENIFKIPTKNIPKEDDVYYYIYNAHFNDKKITFKTDSSRTITFDMNGNIIRNVDTYENVVTQEGHIASKNGEKSLVSDTGKALIPFDKYDSLMEYNEFVYATNYYINGEKPNDIYNLNGKLLAADVYKPIFIMTFDDCMLIYKTANTCGFLYPDGKFAPLVISD